MENSINCINSLLVDIKAKYDKTDKLKTIRRLCDEQHYIEDLIENFKFKIEQIDKTYKKEPVALKNDIIDYLEKIKQLYNMELNKELNNIIQNK